MGLDSGVICSVSFCLKNDIRYALASFQFAHHMIARITSVHAVDHSMFARKDDLTEIQ